ncbi:hypothetical protein [Desertihabitans aurantiacus]|uniref:hypothetical protein n=1 Tax=Desertihabitans aurantiacus TaxID=2282477 RepID=UPI000DF77AB4|nr:hypothetical protein [Desertihabitans aurantiacus]
MLAYLQQPAVLVLLWVAASLLVVGVFLLVASRFVDNDRWPTPRRDLLKDVGVVSIFLTVMIVVGLHRSYRRAKRGAGY